MLCDRVCHDIIEEKISLAIGWSLNLDREMRKAEAALS